MSASASLEAPQPARPADPRSQPAKWRWAIAGLVLIAAAVGLTLWMRTAAKSASGSAQEAADLVPAKRGSMLRSVRVGGTVAAVRFSMIVAPALRGPFRSQMTLVSITPAGTKVQKGDVLAEFDRQAQRSNFEEREADFLGLNEQISKRGAELDIEREKQQSDLQKARNDLESARLENRRNEVLSKIDAEKNQQAFTEAGEQLKMLERTLELRRAAADAEIKLLEIRRQREQLAMEYARHNFERLVITAPIAGMVVLQPFWKGNQMAAPQEGDQIRPGMGFMQVVDSSAMVVKARVNQLDAAPLRVGGRAEVRLDAYNDAAFPAGVLSISPLGQGGGFGGRARFFLVTFAVEGSDPRLIPDITASVDIEIDRAADALLIPRRAVERAPGKNTGLVWVKNAAGKLERREVTLGLRNDIHWAIVKGLKEGELVAAGPGS